MNSKSTAIIVPEVLPALPKGGVKPAGFQQPNIHITVNMPPTPTMQAPPAPPVPPAAQEAPPAAPKSNPVLRYWKWILGLFLLLLIVAAIVHFAKKGTEATPLSAVEQLEQRNRELEEKLAQQSQPQPATITAPAITAPTASSRPVLRAQVVEDYHRQRGGAVVRRVGRVINRDGVRWIPLYRDKSLQSDIVIMEHVDRTPQEVEENMNFEGLNRPSTGHLDIYDVVQTSDGPKNVLFWRMN